MKKTLITLALVVAGVSSFAQGYFYFDSSTRQVWDTVVVSGTNTYKPDSGLDVTFLISTADNPTIAGLATSTATNGTTIVSSYAAAWSDILTNSGGFSLVENAANNNSGVVQETGSVGQFDYSYGGNNNFGATGTTAGNSYYVYVIAWSDAYSTPQAAAAAGAAVGWSNPFSYTTGASAIATGLPTFTTAGMVPFGLAAVPEPSTIALAGMGIASLLAFRRRK